MLLGGVMVVIIIGNLISRYHMDGIDKSFASIYQDRLLPATTITYLAENLYAKRLSMEKFLHAQEAQPESAVAGLLKTHNRHIDSLIVSFEKTYLVDKEAKSLSAFKNRVQEYVLLEQMVLNLHKSGNTDEGKKLFEGVGSDTFQSTITRLNELTHIQSDIGKQLMKESKSEMAGFSLISVLQISLVLVIGIMILVLIQSSRISNLPKKGKEQQFNLN